MNAMRLVAGVIVLFLAGCANLQTVGRSSTLPNNGVAVHLDAIQRVVLTRPSSGSDLSGAAQGNPDSRYPTLLACAEPSPDAIQAYASSFGLGVATPSQQSVSIAQALAASAGSIGLRTQSITLMRDALYRICELYFNGAISRNAAVQLLERSQDLSLGILAIEQLTGAVQAQQVMLNTTSTASAAALINDTQKELDKAKAAETSKKTAQDEAQAAADAQKKIVEDKTADANVAKDKAKKTQMQIDALVPKRDAAKSKLDDASSASIVANNEVAAMEDDLQSQKDTAKRARKAANDAATHAAKMQSDLELAQKADPVDEAKIKAATEKKAVADTARDTKEKAAIGAEKAAEKAAAEAVAPLAKKRDEAKKLDVAASDAEQSLAKIDAQLKKLHADPQQTLADKAADALAVAKQTQKDKDDAVNAATKAFKVAQANTKEIERLGEMAKADASASTGSAGQFSTAFNRYGVNKDTVDALARATVDIVQTIVNKGHLTDSCSAMFMSWESNGKTDPDAKKLMPICEKAIEATLAVYRANGDVTPEDNLVNGCVLFLTKTPTNDDNLSTNRMVTKCGEIIDAATAVYKTRNRDGSRAAAAANAGASSAAAPATVRKEVRKPAAPAPSIM